MSAQGAKWWVEDLTEVCVQFQLDLSCLVDGELDEDAAVRAVAHLEHCSLCRDFFEDTRAQVRAHRELANPDELLERYSVLIGAQAAQEVETIELIHRLASVFYQLGKAYVFMAVRPGYGTYAFEKPVQIGGFQAEGRGFVDGVVESGRGSVGGVDWASARHMLNGKLDKIETPMEKGRRLLEETLHADPTHEEARFFLAYADRHEGKSLRAAQRFRQLFRTAIDDGNRGHAAMQLGKMFADEGDHRRAIARYRWLTISGLVDRDPRFFAARFNIGINYAHLGDRARALEYFRLLLDRHPDRLSDIVRLFANASSTRAVIASQPGFAEAVFETCPELFESELFEAGDEGSEADRREEVQ